MHKTFSRTELARPVMGTIFLARSSVTVAFRSLLCSLFLQIQHVVPGVATTTSHPGVPAPMLGSPHAAPSPGGISVAGVGATHTHELPHGQPPVLRPGEWCCLRLETWVSAVMPSLCRWTCWRLSLHIFFTRSGPPMTLRASNMPMRPSSLPSSPSSSSHSQL